jgi:hypothetical protein
MEVDRSRIYVKVDKSNPLMDELADEWLQKNDPDYRERLEAEEEETENLFVTGPGVKKKTRGGNLH